MFAFRIKICPLNETLEHIDRPLFLGLIRQHAGHFPDHLPTDRCRNQAEIPVHTAGLEPVVAGKALIRPLPGQTDRDLLPGLLAEQVQRHCGQIGHGLIKMPESFFHVVGIKSIKHQHLVIGPAVAGNNIGIVKFTVAFILIADGKGLERTTDMATHERNQTAGIQPPGKKNPKRHITDKMALYRRIQMLA